jgi:RNA polymerase sigma-70 factor (ECF subfamily)
VDTWEWDLIRQVQAGESGAFTPLVRKYELPLRNSMFQILGDADDAADVTQDAFIATFEKVHLYNPEHRFFSWVYRIAFNAALNRINRKKFEKPLLDQDLTSAEPSPYARVETRERDDQIHQAVADLEFKYRVLLVLRHYLDFSYAEIAMITDLPVTTVRSRLHTARVLLKKELLPTVSDGPASGFFRASESRR